MTYTLKDKYYESKKLENAGLVMDELSEGKFCKNTAARKMPIIAAINKTCQEIVNYITENHEALGIKNLAFANEDLIRYRDAVIENFRRLNEGVLSIRQAQIASKDLGGITKSNT
jgi:hypothetical protein